VVAYFSTIDNLEKRAETWTHHLFFKLIPCSQKAHDYDDLYSGDVFLATGDERSRILGDSAALDQTLYKVHIPVTLETMIRQMNVIGDLDVAKYVKTAENDGVCIKLGGGQMWGAELTSNLIQSPVAIHDNVLTVVTDSQQGS